ncbi:hypothetical protein ACRALDRAFT_1049764 [Sodiomyces alcalophilus JCM 7366]|uniref:uncharacterized protein n=1 Tax=Sodiomyces alcalophilus JCM 7366 TaxID=591952 RepID=UPI0039B38F08
MDAPEQDWDIKLQKISGDLIADFDRSLPGFLRKPNGQLRSRVRTGETTRLVSTLLDPFQELPQLLDPHLPRWLPLLAASYLEHLYSQGSPRTRLSRTSTARSQLLEPLPAAICKLLYTLSKIRGPAVILRFLPVEARHLEPLLLALESAERTATDPSSSQREWVWQERYIVLLWLSHLLLAPFDLASISSAENNPDDDAIPSLPGFRWPEGLPGITVRVLPLAIKYIASPGKERDGARDLLVRMVMRRDMQQLGVLDALVNWALASLRPKQAEAPLEHPYFYIGVLSFLASLLKSSVDTSDMDKHLSAVFNAVYAISAEGSPLAAAIRSYAVARKMVIKVIRSVTVLVLSQASQDMAGMELVESSISYLLECLADNDTPVRLAASKALSVITLKLDPDMAEQVVEAVLESLNRNVLWVRNPGNPDAAPTRDLTAVDPLEWHGLTLTLSHLLYRRSPPAEQLPDIIHGLLLGLSFEKRGTSGGSIGTNVRDAACFGIWALARRYTTQELLAVPTKSVVAAKGHSNSTDTSILQVLATELVVAGSLDSSGNIRRGASAALQELIGRHPDTVKQGIWVVQNVDYHAVALRSRAIHEVALGTTKLWDQYGHALLDGLMGWRGVGDLDATARRVAGASFGTLTLELSKSSRGADALQQARASIDMILQRLRSLQTRQVEERHGLLLCLASTLDRFPDILGGQLEDDTLITIPESTLDSIIQELTAILQDSIETTYRRPDLIIEAANRLVVSSVPILQAACIASSGSTFRDRTLRPGFQVVATDSTQDFLHIVAAVDSLELIPATVQGLVSKFHPVVTSGLGRPEKEVISAASEAALILLAFSRPVERDRITTQWADTVRQRPTSRTASEKGYFFALTAAHPIVIRQPQINKSSDGDVTSAAILARWAADTDIDTRVAILQSLSQSVMLRDRPLSFLDLLAEGLNDYTTNARGDVGSHVRLEALRATKCIWQSLGTVAQEQRHTDNLRTAVSKLFLRAMRLAAEKLDRVRTVAQDVLGLTLLPSHASSFAKLTFSSSVYFHRLLSLCNERDAMHPLISESVGEEPQAWMAELLAGYVTSADTGNEDLVIASRAALTDFCDEAPEQLEAVCAGLVHNLAARQGQDRVVVPTLEIIGFLFHVGLFARARTIDMRRLCLLVQKAGYKTGNVRKLEACVRVYGGVASLKKDGEGEEGVLAEKRREGIKEARKRLGALLHHPWPRVRSAVIDVLWMLFCEGEDGDAAARLKGVDWGRADKGAVKSAVAELGLA